VTRDEVAKAWALVKSRKSEAATLPKQIEIEGALEELYPDLIKPIRPGVLWHNYCRYCRGQIEVMFPQNLIVTGTLARRDVISIAVICPHCKRETETRGLDVFEFICPKCSKQWSALKSHAGKKLKCKNCQQEFLPVPTANSRSQQPATEEQIKSLVDSGFMLDKNVSLSFEQLNEFLKLEGMPPRAADKEFVNSLGIKIQNGDAFAIYGVAVLARRLLEMMQNDDLEITHLGLACMAAQNDPDYLKATITLDKYGQATFAWPESKLKKWYRMGM
jgi:hypothetical protein